jgi:RHS repeat-associated protein
MNYDKNGNITNLHRTGGLDDQVETLTIDNLTYSYPDNSNQLAKVKDDSNEPQGFKDDTATDPDDATNDYQYDENGNMIADQNKGIDKIDYNHLNLPTAIYFDGGNKILYLYDATGKKVKKVIDVVGEQTITHYLDGFQYKADELQFFATAEGYANISHTIFESGFFVHEAETINNQYSYIYNYVDHLGNIRLSYGKDPSNGVLRIIEENHYYPFGLKHTNYDTDKMIYVKEMEVLKIKLSPNNIKTGYNYKYNGKELQDELGLNMYDYGAMLYDPAIGRRNNIDPKAEVSRRWSPYSYCYNNPMRFVDPDGMQADDIIFRGKNGNEIRVETAGKDKYIDVPTDIKENRTLDLGFKNLDSERLAGGFSFEVSADVKAGWGGSASASVTSVMYANKEYGGYLYNYVGGELKGTGGAQLGASANIGVNFLIMANTAKNPDYNPEGFAGTTKSIGVSQDIKDVVGAGWSASAFKSGDWKGLSFGVSVGIGVSTNFGAISYGQSNSILLNNVIRTEDRSFIDRALNLNPQTTLPQATIQYLSK